MGIIVRLHNAHGGAVWRCYNRDHLLPDAVLRFLLDEFQYLRPELTPDSKGFGLLVSQLEAPPALRLAKSAMRDASAAPSCFFLHPGVLKRLMPGNILSHTAIEVFLSDVIENSFFHFTGRMSS